MAEYLCIIYVVYILFTYTVLTSARSAKECCYLRRLGKSGFTNYHITRGKSSYTSPFELVAPGIEPGAFRGPHRCEANVITITPRDLIGRI